MFLLDPCHFSFYILFLLLSCDTNCPVCPVFPASQVYHFVPSSRVLVCTPSNSAADLVCIRLHHSGFLHAASLARINASCRQEEVLQDN